MSSSSTRFDDWGKLLLRVTVSGLLLFHGIGKIGTGGLNGIEDMLGNHGLPEFFAYGVYIGEIVAPVCLILGIVARMAALVIAGNMVMAIFLAHMSDLFALNDHGAWAVELPMFFLLAAVASALVGPGRMVVQRRSPSSSS
jgi:putative oxidoreductase